MVAGGGGCPFIRACVNIFLITTLMVLSGNTPATTRNPPPTLIALDFSTRDGVVPSFHGSFPKAKKTSKQKNKNPFHINANRDFADLTGNGFFLRYISAR